MNIKNIYKEKLIFVNRVSKTVKGGRVFNFVALIVVGNKNYIGYAYEKAKEVPLAINKSLEKAKKNMIKINLYNNTIPCTASYTHLSSKVFIKPSFKNTGIVSNNIMRSIFYVLNIKNIISKLYGSNNPINVVIATINALKSVKSLKYISKKRHKNILNILK